MTDEKLAAIAAPKIAGAAAFAAAHLPLISQTIFSSTAAVQSFRASSPTPTSRPIPTLCSIRRQFAEQHVAVTRVGSIRSCCLRSLAVRVAQVWSQPGNGHYAAANAAAGGWAAGARASGLPATTMQFGAFGGTGMAAAHVTQLAAIGMRPLDAAQVPGTRLPNNCVRACMQRLMKM